MLEAAQAQFDVLLTMDKGLPDQQKLSRFAIAAVILRARSNRLAGLLPLLPKHPQSWLSTPPRPPAEKRLRDLQSLQ